MQWFETPSGEAGCDQLDAMEESVQAAIEQMFSQVAKRDSLSFGVGRTAWKPSDDPDLRMRLDAQKRECDGLVVFHAGKALETSLQVIYARVNNRIPGREYPEDSDALKTEMREVRRTHNLASLYDAILESIGKRSSELRQPLEDEFEAIFQVAVHKGVQDVIVDGERVGSFRAVEDTPFRESIIGGISRGAEYTADHSSPRQMILPQLADRTDFSYLPCGKFPEFLAKADKAYYGEHNMSWARYSARDHERGRPYAVAGARFFARLVRDLVAMANEQWIWHPRFAARWHERRRAIIGDIVKDRIAQSFAEAVELPEMKPVDEMMELEGSIRSQHPNDYDTLHGKLTFNGPAGLGGRDRA